MTTNESNPKLLLAVQMLCIGVVLFILGIAVVLQSPLGRMSPTFRFWSVVSNGGIILTGIGFGIGGAIKYARCRRG